MIENNIFDLLPGEGFVCFLRSTVKELEHPFQTTYDTVCNEVFIAFAIPRVQYPSAGEE